MYRSADRNTGQSDKGNVLAKGTDRSELQHIKFRNTCCHLQHKCEGSDDWCTVTASVITGNTLNSFNPYSANVESRVSS